MSTPTDARARIAAIQEHEAWAIIRRSTRTGDRDTVGVVGGRRWVAESLLDVPLEHGPPPAGAPVRPAGRRPVPAGRRARLRGPRRRHAAGGGRRRDRARVHRRRRPRRDRGRGRSRSPTAAASSPTTTTTPRSSSAIIKDEIGQGEGANLVIGRHFRAVLADWGADAGARRVPPAAGARARRVLDLPVLHRRPLPDRRQPGAARQRARRRRADEPDQRHLPGARRGRRRAEPEAAAAGVPPGREGDLRALHGRRRRAQDDVRHLPRGRPGARAVPQADDAPRSTPSTSSPAAPPATSARCCATRCTPPPSPAARSRTPAG